MTDQAKPRKRRPGGGRKTRSTSGEVSKNHSIRWLDKEWADVCFIGQPRVRELVKLDAARKRKHAKADETTRFEASETETTQESAK